MPILRTLSDHRRLVSSRKMRRQSRHYLNWVPICAGMTLAAGVLLWFSLPAFAADPPAPKGLLITPVRQFLSTDAGKTLDSSFVVANLTSSGLEVKLQVQQFSVQNYSYDYTFQQPDNDWLHLAETQVPLQPGQSKTIRYTVAVPTKTAPGGHYYTLLASAQVTSQGFKNTIQAADLLYLTVNGNLTRVSHLEGSSIPWIVFGKAVPFTLQPVNTGNVYSYVYVSGQLHGLLVKPPQTSSGHILIPGKIRTLTSSIASPVLPGIYKATYGYKTEGNWVIQQSHWILYLPPWSIAFVLAAVLVAGAIYRRKKQPPTPADWPEK